MTDADRASGQGGWFWGRNPVQRALLERKVGMEVDVCPALLTVAQPQRDRRGVDPGIEQPHRGRVPQDVHRHPL